MCCIAGYSKFRNIGFFIISSLFEFPIEFSHEKRIIWNTNKKKWGQDEGDVSCDKVILHIRELKE